MVVSLLASEERALLLEVEHHSELLLEETEQVSLLLRLVDTVLVRANECLSLINMADEAVRLHLTPLILLGPLLHLNTDGMFEPIQSL